MEIYAGTPDRRVSDGEVKTLAGSAMAADRETKPFTTQVNSREAPTRYNQAVDVPLHHGLLDKLSRELAEEYQHIQDELKNKPKNIQLSGYLAEAVWKRLVGPWLPPLYEFEPRRHLVYEQPVDGESRSAEIDLVLFHPSYPRRLRDEHEVLISGIIAAFSVKLTLTPDGLREAIEMAELLRRGMKARIREPIGDLVSPLVTGVLAQSHRGFGDDPQETVQKILLEAAHRLDGSGRPDDDGDYVSAGLATHPRNELDFVCIADLNCWRRRPFVMWQNSAVPWAQDEHKFIAPWTARKSLSDNDNRLAEPIAIFVSELWQKLAYRDSALKAIADGFRLTDTTGPGAGRFEPKSLRPLVHGDTYAALRASGALAVDG